MFAAPAHAQAPQKPAAAKPAAAPDGPRFEIRRYVFDGATLVSQQELEAATAPYTGKQRGFGDVQRALEVIERTYSAGGWSAVQVVLPEQELERGEVRFQIIEAKVGRVIVEGNKFFDEANIRASIPSLAPGRAPNINQISRNLRIANESPAKQITVLLRGGQEEGMVDAVARVADESPVRASVTVDTTGNDETGRLRVGLGYQNSNVYGRDHILTLQYVGAPHRDTHPNAIVPFPGKQVFIIGAGYRIPLYGSGDTLDFSVGSSTVNSGTIGELFTISGAGGIMGARYTRNFNKIGDYEHRMVFSLDHRGFHNKGVRALGGTVQLIPDVTTHPVGVLYSGVLRRQDSESGFSLGFSQNFPGGNDGRGASDGNDNPGPGSGFCGSRSSTVSDHFECANARFFVWRWALSHVTLIGEDWQGRFAMNGQLTRDMLVTGEQFGLGGAESVRGFREREISNDSGYRGTFELYTADWGSKTGIAGARARGVLFVDWGGVKRNRPHPGDIHATHVGSYGAGVRFSRGTNLSLRVDYAIIWDPGGTQGRNDGRLHASMSYVF